MQISSTPYFPSNGVANTVARTFSLAQPFLEDLSTIYNHQSSTLLLQFITMSASGRGGAGGDKPPQGFSKFIRRAGKVLRPKSTPPSASESLQEVRASASSRPHPDPTITTPIATPAPKPTTAPTPVPVPKTEVKRPSGNAAAHIKLREDKARALFAKYGLTLEPGEWTTQMTGQAEWIEKKVVMRVHRQCHRCKTTFGADKICPNCSHTRCKKCPRFPSKRPKDQKRDPAAIRIDNDPAARADTKALTLMTKHGKEHTRKHPVHRVRRTCHKCDTLFVGKATQCENCKHQRCPQCPREP